MHPDELQVTEDVVRGLVADQFPEWRGARIRRIRGAGTVNAIFRIGDELAARFPLSPSDPDGLADALRSEAAAMTELHAVCSAPTPVHIAHGLPGPGYPQPWSVQTWLPGAVATPDGLGHSLVFAEDLVSLLRSLRSAGTDGRRFAGAGRGGDLQDSDEWMALCFEESEGLLPIDRLRALWERFRSIPRSGADRMTHGDLTPANLLVDGQRLVGVLDGGGFSAADPALDLVAVWHLLDADARSAVRTALGIGALEWRRGAAWAFQQAMGLVWYYRESNPGMSALGRSTLGRILSDPEVSTTDPPTRSQG